MENINLLYILIIVLFSSLLGLLAYLVANKLKKGKYDEKNHRILLEDIRRSFESQLYSINDRLIQNEERWKDVNHLLVGQQYHSVDGELSENNKVYLSEFLRANGMRENDLLIENRLIFVLTPFHDRFAEDYAVIKKSCEDAGFICIRGDEQYFKGDIFPEMLKYIVKARLVIANINGRNANVYYELGIAQALDKPVLLISGNPEDLAIDIKSKRFLIYTNFEELKIKLKEELKIIKAR
jgi:hypothetical protein